jgi:hypothetical protein
MYAGRPKIATQNTSSAKKYRLINDRNIQVAGLLLVEI